jgi:hypothetical protein
MSFARRPLTYALVVFTASASVGLTQPPPKPKAAPPAAKTLSVMERKLKHAQGLLEGLAMKDFVKIEKSADELMQCVKEATWRINDTDKYLMYSNDFIREIEGLQKAAKKKNVDAATLAYMEMTMTCVKCHEHLRETRIGLAPAIVPPAVKVAGKE